MKTNNKTKTLKGFAFLFLTIAMLAFASAALIYSDTTKYSPSSAHTYDITDSTVGYVTLDTRATAANENCFVVFNYLNGITFSSPTQNVAYLSWNTNVFVNPNPSLTVLSVSVYGGPHVYFSNFYVYSDVLSNGNNGVDGEGSVSCPTDVKQCLDGSYVGRNTELDCAFDLCPEEIICGDGNIDEEEECDAGENNGIKCSATYGSSCTYCSSECTTEVARGEYCGDGILNLAYERCDDGNTINNDKCTNECKKPFEVTVEDFEPLVWQCDSRVVYDDATEPGRVSMDGKPLVERMNNYAFEGEQIKWKVLVMDKNGIEKVKDVYVTVDGGIEANCKRIKGDEYTPNDNYIGEISLFNSVGGSIGLGDSEEEEEEEEESESINPNRIDPSCNARILEEKLTEFNSRTMAYYECTLTVETFESMQGEVDVLVEAEDLDGVIGTMDEAEYWFFNPVIELSIDGEIMFDEIRPGTSSYSERIIIGNDAEYGSGVLLDMFISGTDFYDSSSSGAMCGTTNQLKLKNFAYYATNGAYSTRQDMQNQRTCDAEGYCSINYGIGFNDPFKFYDRNEIIQARENKGYYLANVLSPGAEMTLIFRLNLPEPCNGDFDTGAIYFWGEAI